MIIRLLEKLLKGRFVREEHVALLVKKSEVLNKIFNLRHSGVSVKFDADKQVLLWSGAVYEKYESGYSDTIEDALYLEEVLNFLLSREAEISRLRMMDASKAAIEKAVLTAVALQNAAPQTDFAPPKECTQIKNVPASLKVVEPVERAETAEEVLSSYSANVVEAAKDIMRRLPDGYSFE